MGIKDLYGTDQNLESGEGVQLDFDGDIITIHRAGGSNEKFNTVFSQKMKPYQRRYENGTLDEETSRRILMEAFAEAVVVDWDISKETATDESGNKLKCTKDNIMWLFTEFPDLFSAVQEDAFKVSTFRAENKETASKNSKAS